MITIPSASSDLLIFLHVPKTAGTTLNRIIEKQYSPTRIYSIPGGWGSRWSTRKFKRLSTKRLSRLEAVKGHLHYGIHRGIPQAVTYMTMLREPVDRIISSYYYARSNRIHPLHHIVVDREISLAQFLDLVPWGHNLQTKLIGGIPMSEINPPQALAAARRGEIVPWDQFAGRHCDGEMLELAKRNLEHHFSSVGLTERFAESLALMKIAYGWQLSRFQSFRKSKQRPRDTYLAEELVNRIRQINVFDLELYAFAEKLFQTKLERHQAEVREILAHFDTMPEPHRWYARCQDGLAWMRFAISLARSLV